jgi:hypothetical protein
MSDVEVLPLREAARRVAFGVRVSVQQWQTESTTPYLPAQGIVDVHTPASQLTRAIFLNDDEFERVASWQTPKRYQLPKLGDCEQSVAYCLTYSEYALGVWGWITAWSSCARVLLHERNTKQPEQLSLRDFVDNGHRRYCAPNSAIPELDAMPIPYFGIPIATLDTWLQLETLVLREWMQVPKRQEQCVATIEIPDARSETPSLADPPVNRAATFDVVNEPPEPIEKMLPDDGLDEIARAVTWGGKTFDDLAKRMVGFFRVILAERRKGIEVVPRDLIEQSAKDYLSSAELSQVFKVNRKDWPRGKLHPAHCLVERVGTGYRMIDKAKVPDKVPGRS